MIILEIVFVTNFITMPKPIPQTLQYFLSDCLQDESTYTTKPMMWWYCIYKSGKIFAIYALDMIYFKTHKNNIDDYIKSWAKQFEFKKKNGTIAKMSYYILPEEIMEDSSELQMWIEKALDY